ncbi:type II toxin-antitoxin system RelE/ParE family toxin [Salmonella enterica subsp. enterica serovar Anatum]|jgi:toxin ParE1/3/4|nr:type II toxin-antitoxin system RelE/ParE family toxin [Salmonella enterica subsp. enterica serovar Anatum]EDS7427716.1 type II toxin-antitoxin system RelE/ParE family toxin [Salmonella enterica subsp. enterica serovar Braenderup]
MMMSTLIWEEEAINDRTDYFEWLYKQNPNAADEADQHIEDTVDLLIHNPFLGRADEYVRGVRVLIIRGLSLNVYYQESNGTVRVLHILHQSRNISKLI